MSVPPLRPEEPAARFVTSGGSPEQRGLDRILFEPGGRVRPGLRAVLFLAPAWVLIRVIESTVFELIGARASPLTTLTISRGLITLVLLVMSAMYLLLLDDKSFRTLGLWFYGGWVREVLWGVLIGLGLMGVTVAALVAGHGVVYRGLNPGPGVSVILLRIFVLFVAGAAMEEVLFRGYGLQRLVDSLGAYGGVVLISAYFCMEHAGNPAVTVLSTANTFLAGVLLAVAYLRTRALWLPIGLHWAWNFFQGEIFSLPVSGIRFAKPLFEAVTLGPVWLTGGRYGPEGGLAATVVCVVGILWLARTRWLTPSPAMQEALQLEGR